MSFADVKTEVLTTYYIDYFLQVHFFSILELGRYIIDTYTYIAYWIRLLVHCVRVHTMLGWYLNELTVFYFNFIQISSWHMRLASVLRVHNKRWAN